MGKNKEHGWKNGEGVSEGTILMPPKAAGGARTQLGKSFPPQQHLPVDSRHWSCHLHQFLCLPHRRTPFPAGSQSNASAHRGMFAGRFQERKMTIEKEGQIPVLGEAAKPEEAPPSPQVRPMAVVRVLGWTSSLGTLSYPQPYFQVKLFLLHFLGFVLYFIEASTEAEICPYHLPHGNKESFLSGNDETSKLSPSVHVRVGIRLTQGMGHAHTCISPSTGGPWAPSPPGPTLQMPLMHMSRLAFIS